MKYHTVLIDPPWNEIGGGRIHRGADRHYNLIKTPEIISLCQEVLKDRLEENCHCYLWVTNNHPPDGLETLEALGFRYIPNLVWVKDRFGLGQYYRGKHELLLFGVKGVLPYKDKTQTTVIHAKRRLHSQKPDEQYQKIEAISYPPYLELFARYEWPGWDNWGNEIQNIGKRKNHSKK